MKKLLLLFLLFPSLCLAGQGSFTGMGQVAYSSCTSQTVTMSYSSTTPFTVGDSDRTITNSATSGLTVALDTTNHAICTVVAGAVHAVGAGSCVVTADQAGNGTYCAASQVTQSITVSAGGGGYSDTFTGSNGTALATHDANWTSLPGYATTNVTIQSNMAETGNYATGGGFYNASTADISQAVFKGAPTSSYVSKFITVRAGAGTLGYEVYFNYFLNPSNVVLTKNGTYQDTWVISTLDLTVDHTIKLTATGTSTTTLELFIDGASQGTKTDSSSPITSGHPGFFVDAGSNGTIGYTAVDNWQDH